MYFVNLFDQNVTIFSFVSNEAVVIKIEADIVTLFSSS